MHSIGVFGALFSWVMGDGVARCNDPQIFLQRGKGYFPGCFLRSGILGTFWVVVIFLDGIRRILYLVLRNFLGAE